MIADGDGDEGWGRRDGETRTTDTQTYAQKEADDNDNDRTRTKTEQGGKGGEMMGDGEGCGCYTTRHGAPSEPNQKPRESAACDDGHDGGRAKSKKTTRCDAAAARGYIGGCMYVTLLAGVHKRVDEKQGLRIMTGRVDAGGLEGEGGRRMYV